MGEERPKNGKPLDIELAEKAVAKIVNVLSRYRDGVVLIGGWVTRLVTEEDTEYDYIGTTDIDLMTSVKSSSPKRVRAFFEEIYDIGVYKDSSDEPFRARIDVDGKPVFIDFLVPDDEKTVIKTLQLGGIEPEELIGGALVRDTNGIAIIPPGIPTDAAEPVFITVPKPHIAIVLKGLALGHRDNPKDAYDLYFLLRNYPGGIEKAVADLRGLLHHPVVIPSIRYINDAFSEINSKQITDVTDQIAPQLGTGAEKRESVKNDIYYRVQKFLELIYPFIEGEPDEG